MSVYSYIDTSLSILAYCRDATLAIAILDRLVAFLRRLRFRKSIA